LSNFDVSTPLKNDVVAILAAWHQYSHWCWWLGQVTALYTMHNAEKCWLHA